MDQGLFSLTNLALGLLVAQTVSRNAQQGQLGGIGSNFGVATDAGGNVWVADQSNARIVEFDHAGNLIKSIGVGGGPEPWQNHALGCGGGLMNRPTSLFIHPVSGNIFVTDTICRDIEVFSNDGHWLYNFNLDLRDLGIFTPIPRGIDLGPDGLVYFVEFNLKQVFVYDVNGVRQRVFPYQADLQDARGLSIDRTRGKVYVVDGGTNGADIYQWNLDGTLVRITFGGGSVWTDVGRAFARYRPDGTFVSRWGTQGSDPGQFRDNIFGLDVVGNETSGTVYATDSGNCRLQLFDYSGNVLAYMGSCGDGPDQMAHPNQVVVKGKPRLRRR